MSAPVPYWQNDGLSLYLGDSREALPALGVTPDLIVADPPYGETGLAWDTWPDGWLDVMAKTARSLWCFGTMRMFLLHGPEFTTAGWKLSQDVIWEKQNGSAPCPSDRFMRVHENALHWYRGDWRAVYHDQQRVAWDGPDKGFRDKPNGRERYHESGGRFGAGIWIDDGTRVARSVIKAQSMHQRSLHPTEKPVDPLLITLIKYGCPPGGLVVDPFAGSASTLEAARACGRRAVGIEGDERYAELAARRLATPGRRIRRPAQPKSDAEPDLFGGAA